MHVSSPRPLKCSLHHPSPITPPPIQTPSQELAWTWSDPLPGRGSAMLPVGCPAAHHLLIPLLKSPRRHLPDPRPPSQESCIHPKQTNKGRKTRQYRYLLTLSSEHASTPLLGSPPSLPDGSTDSIAHWSDQGNSNTTVLWSHPIAHLLPNSESVLPRISCSFLLGILITPAPLPLHSGAEPRPLLPSIYFST